MATPASITCARCNDEMLTVKRSKIMSLQYKFQIDNPGIELESPGLQDQETVKLKANSELMPRMHVKERKYSITLS